MSQAYPDEVESAAARARPPVTWPLALLCAGAAVLVVLLIALPPRPFEASAYVVARDGAQMEALLDAVAAEFVAGGDRQAEPASSAAPLAYFSTLIDEALDALVGTGPAGEAAASGVGERPDVAIRGEPLAGGRLLRITATSRGAGRAVSEANNAARRIVDGAAPPATRPGDSANAVLLARRLEQARDRLAAYRSSHAG